MSEHIDANATKDLETKDLTLSRMILSCVYKLIYPAVLGSMIYQMGVDLELPNPSNSGWKGAWEVLTQLIKDFDFWALSPVFVVAIYVCDWLYTTRVHEFTKCTNKPESLAWLNKKYQDLDRGNRSS